MDDAKLFRKGVLDVLQGVWQALVDSHGAAGVRTIIKRLNEDQARLAGSFAAEKKREPDHAKILCTSLVSGPSARPSCVWLSD